MICHDWRDASPGLLASLYAAERRRWMEDLSWDLGPSLATVEQARAAGELPGVLVCDRRGNPVGWSFYVLSHGLLQVGGIVADSAGVLRLMLNHICASPEAHMAQGLSCFLFPVSSSVQSALARQRFALEPYEYLCLDLERNPVAPPASGHGDTLPGPRPWRQEDTTGAVRLLARAYAGDPASRCFAPHASLEEWAHYVGQVLSGPGCGRPALEASFVVPSTETPSGLAGLVLTTFVADETAHVAQVAVDPLQRGHGIATALIQAASSRARAAGARRLTLLVAQHNRAAQTLYAAFGFVRVSALVYGHRGPVPRRIGRPASEAVVAL
jgi:ribosomal protein S18 acetylase RimI-like enzyme